MVETPLLQIQTPLISANYITEATDQCCQNSFIVVDQLVVTKFNVLCVHYQLVHTW
jgi:hypothetical protein